VRRHVGLRASLEGETRHREQQYDVGIDVANVVVGSIGRHGPSVRMIPGPPQAILHILNHNSDKTSVDGVTMSTKDVTSPVCKGARHRLLRGPPITEPQEVPIRVGKTLDNAFLKAASNISEADVVLEHEHIPKIVPFGVRQHVKMALETSSRTDVHEVASVHRLRGRVEANPVSPDFHPEASELFFHLDTTIGAIFQIDDIRTIKMLNYTSHACTRTFRSESVSTLAVLCPTLGMTTAGDSHLEIA